MVQSVAIIGSKMTGQWIEASVTPIVIRSVDIIIVEVIKVI